MHIGRLSPENALVTFVITAEAHKMEGCLLPLLFSEKCSVNAY